MIKVIPDVVDYIHNLITQGASVLRCKKITPVRAVPGKVGIVVFNSLDNHSSKVGTDVFGNPDWVITSLGGEQYVVHHKVFINNYKLVDKVTNSYVKCTPQLVVQCNEDVSFELNDGNKFILRNGGYFTLNAFDDIAGIQKEAFESTYKVISRNEADKDEALSILVNKPSYITWIGEYCGGPLPPNTKVIEIDSVHSFLGDDILAWLETSKSVSANEARHNPDFNPEKDIYYYIRSNHLSSKPIELQRDLKKSPR